MVLTPDNLRAARIRALEATEHDSLDGERNDEWVEVASIESVESFGSSVVSDGDVDEISELASSTQEAQPEYTSDLSIDMDQISLGSDIERSLLKGFSIQCSFHLLSFV
jgi:hypothetical protein